MANDSLEHEARTRQSHFKKLGIFGNNLGNSGTHVDILQSKTFSLTFTASQWQLFWRLLTVGCMLADELLDNASVPTLSTKSQTALLWNRLSDELAQQLTNDAVDEHGEVAQHTRR